MRLPRAHPSARGGIPIHEIDICEQTEALLGVASVPATIVNWGGDEPVSTQQWCEYFGELTGKTPQLSTNPIPGTQRGVVLDVNKRAQCARDAIGTGP